MKATKQVKTIRREQVVIKQDHVEEITLRVSRLEAHILKVLTGFVGGTDPWQRGISGPLYSRLCDLVGSSPETGDFGLSCGNGCVVFDEGVTIENQSSLMGSHWKLVRAHDDEGDDR
jgi:hypothetical protein